MLTSLVFWCTNSHTSQTRYELSSRKPVMNYMYGRGTFNQQYKWNAITNQFTF